jgi:hypothetical protein
MLKDHSIRKDKGSASVTNDIIKSFNRDTAWLATGVMAVLFVAALVIALQERQKNATLAEYDLLPSVNSATVGSVVAEDSNSKGNITLGADSRVDHGFTETPLPEIPFSQMESAASTPTSAPDFTPEKNHYAHRPDPSRVGGTKARDARKRTSVAFRYTRVRRRLLELWHQSLARSEKLRNWAAFSNLNAGVNKKAAYTAEANH